MDLRLLQYFVTTAEFEHIGRAAERLHISQSPLSRQIRLLENELGLELFLRERQRIRLTESGKWLLGQAQKLLAHADRIREEAGQRSLGRTGTLSVAFVSGAIWNGVLPKLLRRFHVDFPDARLELHNMRSNVQMEAVESGRVDLGFVSMPAISGDLETTCVSEEPFVLVVPARHRLARKRSINPGDLDGVNWILLSHSIAPERHARFLAACAEAGFVPKVVQKVTEPHTLLGLVESGLGVGLMARGARKQASSSLKFHNLPWLPFKFRTYMIRPRHGRQPIADSFAAHVPNIRVERSGPWVSQRLEP